MWASIVDGALRLFNSLISIFRPTPSEDQEKARDEVLKRRAENKTDDRPPKSWPHIVWIAFLLFSCSGPLSSVRERKIFWPSTVVCNSWTGGEPILRAVDPDDDLKLIDGHGMSCLSKDDVIKIETYLVDQAMKLKTCEKNTQDH